MFLLFFHIFVALTSLRLYEKGNGWLRHIDLDVIFM